MRYLQDTTGGTSFKGKHCISNNIERFLANLVKLELKVTFRASEKLRTFLKEMNDLNVESLDSKQATTLSNIMCDIRMTLDAEIAGIYAFVTTPKRIDSQKLLQNMGLLFSPGVFDQFPDIAKYDFNESGKCIAFERPRPQLFIF